MYYAPPRAASGGVDLLRRTILTLALLTLFLTAGSAFADAGAELYPFYDGQAYRLMDSNGDMLSDLSCDYISAIQLDDSQKRFVAFMSDENGSRAVLLDANGQPLTDQDYESIYYQDGALMTVKNGLCGIIDENGDELLPVKYTSIVPTGEGAFFTSTDDPFDGIADEIYLTYPDGKCRYLGLSGGLYGAFSEGLLCTASRDGLYGYLDTDGKWVIAPVYEHAADFSGGLAEVMRGGLYGLIDKQGNLVLPIKYDFIASSASTGDDARIIVAIADGSAAIYDRASMMPIAMVSNVQYAFLPTAGTAMLLNGETIRLYSLAGHSVELDVGINDSVEVLSDTQVFVSDPQTMTASIIDISGSGKPAVEFTDTASAYPMFNGAEINAICVSRDDGAHTLWGVYALDGSEILPVEYDSIVQTCDGVFSVKAGSECGLIRADGEWIFRNDNTGGSSEDNSDYSDTVEAETDY